MSQERDFEFRAPTRAIDDERLAPLERLYLVWLFSVGSPSWWSATTTATTLGVGEKTVRRARKTLETTGWITVTKTFGTSAKIALHTPERSLSPHSSDSLTGPQEHAPERTQGPKRSGKGTPDHASFRTEGPHSSDSLTAQFGLSDRTVRTLSPPKLERDLSLSSSGERSDAREIRTWDDVFDIAAEAGIDGLGILVANDAANPATMQAMNKLCEWEEETLRGGFEAFLKHAKELRMKREQAFIPKRGGKILGWVIGWKATGGEPKPVSSFDQFDEEPEFDDEWTEENPLRR